MLLQLALPLSLRTPPPSCIPWTAPAVLSTHSTASRALGCKVCETPLSIRVGRSLGARSRFDPTLCSIRPDRVWLSRWVSRTWRSGLVSPSNVFSPNPEGYTTWRAVLRATIRVNSTSESKTLSAARYNQP
uniref:Uncharacterized protein n=1 Tax=Lygus hesperus TaxID=30085 RepID=A0A146LF77_LYGHE